MKKTVGFALTGSFCSLKQTFELMRSLKDEYDLVPIVSETVAKTDTRFYKKEEVFAQLEEICNKTPISTITEAEPLGPASPLDLLVICPCTGNTLSKIALGITDTSVTMACKAHRRNNRPVLIALSTNDALSGSAPNLGKLAQRDGFYFAPLRQDAPQGKPHSLQFDPRRLPQAIKDALSQTQSQPVFL